MDDLSVTVRTRWLILIGVVVLAAGTVAGVVWVRRARSEAAPATVVLQAATDPGVNSFVPVASSRPVAVALPPSGTAAGVTATVDADSGVRVVSGTADRLYAGSPAGSAELYGGSGSPSACDAGAIAAFLAAHPDKAAAWAGVRGIGQDAIPGYLASLTPVVLVHDTVVTNHGFAGGAATAFASVLQAGTAVLVDATGLPVVRCACGNPLSAAPRTELSGADLQGTRWDGFDPGGTLTVVPGAAVTQFVVVDVATGQDATVTAGPAAVPPTTLSTAVVSTSAAPAAGTGPCTLDMTWPQASPGWIEPLGGDLTCQQMIDQWRRFEQWPGERGGSANWVTADDGWTCTTTLASNTTSAVGGCALAERRFVVHRGQPSVSTSSSPSDGSDCTFDLSYPVTGPGWIDADDALLTCRQMADLWRRYEQVDPATREGPLGLVVFDQATKCARREGSTSLYDGNVPADSSLVGQCGVGVRIFRVYGGALGQRSANASTRSSTEAAATMSATTPESAPESTSSGDLLITPSGNIECARRDGQFACTIKQINGDLGDERCPGERGFIARLDATGYPQSSDCRGDFFDGIGWPDPTGYGTTATLGDVRCTVEETGVTCTNLDGHGFTLARAGYTRF